MSDKEFRARKMVSREFISESDYTKRSPDGRRAHFAVEGNTGATITGLGWEQACQLADHLNKEHAANLAKVAA